MKDMNGNKVTSDNEEIDSTRRRVLAASVSLFAAAIVPGSASAARSRDKEDNSRLPVLATGKRQHKFRPKGDFYIHEERFLSPDLRKTHDTPVVEFDPVRVPREEAPDDWKDNGVMSFTFKDTAVFGTFEEHVNAEDKIHAQIQTSSQISIQSSHPTYNDRYFSMIPVHWMREKGQ